MIRYALRCAHGHGFDAWFRSSAAYDEQRAARQVTCAICGDAEVEKAVMAPSVISGGPATEPAAAPRLDRPASPLERALSELRRKIEESSDYVGSDFAAEARRIQAGEADERSIWGEASIGEVRSLAEGGIPVAPIPVIRRRDD